MWFVVDEYVTRDRRRGNISSLVALNPSPMPTSDWPRFRFPPYSNSVPSVE